MKSIIYYIFKKNISLNTLTEVTLDEYNILPVKDVTLCKKYVVHFYELLYFKDYYFSKQFCLIRLFESHDTDDTLTNQGISCKR